MKLTDMTPIIRDPIVSRQSENSYKIQWDMFQNMPNVSIDVSESADHFDKIDGIKIEKKGKTVFISGLDPQKRYFFKIVPKTGSSVITAERGIMLDGAVNFRDLGGYTASDGQMVKWGQVFRSDSLARLSDNDKSRLRNLDLKTVVDFRSPEEVDKMPDRLPDSNSLKYMHLPIYRTGLNPVTSYEKIKKGDISWLTRDFIIRGYINSIEKFPDIWGTMIKTLVVSENRPLVFHCTAGKDRTGVGAALIFRALHVPEETVIYDHGLSNDYIAKVLKKMYNRIESYGISPEQVAPYFTAVKESIVALLDHIRKNYGTVHDYLTKRAGIPEKTLRLLEKELLQ